MLADASFQMTVTTLAGAVFLRATHIDRARGNAVMRANGEIFFVKTSLRSTALQLVGRSGGMIREQLGGHLSQSSQHRLQAPAQRQSRLSLRARTAHSQFENGSTAWNSLCAKARPWIVIPSPFIFVQSTAKVRPGLWSWVKNISFPGPSASRHLRTLRWNVRKCLASIPPSPISNIRKAPLPPLRSLAQHLLGFRPNRFKRIPPSPPIMSHLALLERIFLLQILPRALGGHSCFQCTHTDRFSLVALDNEPVELGSSDHNPEQHPPPRPESNSKRPTPKNLPFNG